MFGERKTVVQNIQEFFVKPPDPKELVRKWQSDIRSANHLLCRICLRSMHHSIQMRYVCCAAL